MGSSRSMNSWRPRRRRCCLERSSAPNFQYRQAVSVRRPARLSCGEIPIRCPGNASRRCDRLIERLYGMASVRVLLPTTLVGSYPQPDWLIDRKRLADMVPPRTRRRELWRVGEKLLEQAQDDPTN